MDDDRVARDYLAPTFPGLDALRAVGALAVLTTHTAFWAGEYTRNGTWGAFLARLDVGVAIFFVLSGFLLVRPWLARAAVGAAPPPTGRYLWKRFLRIWPAYVVVAVLALGLVEANADHSAGDWLATLLLLDVYRDPVLPAGLTQMWSLAVEVSFYLALPLLMLLALGRRRRLATGRVAAVLVAMVAATLWWQVSGAGTIGGSVPGQPQQWLPGYLDWFAVGIALALAHVHWTHPERPRRWAAPLVAAARQPGSCWAAAAGLMLMMSTPLAGPTLLVAPTASETLVKNVVYALVGGLVVLPGVFGDEAGAYARALGHRLPRHLGHTSYSLFCVHLPILHLVMWTTGWELFQGRALEIWALTLALSVLAAELLYRLVERPALRLKDVGARRAARTDPLDATAPATEASTR